jgi:hypothetical protein
MRVTMLAVRKDTEAQRLALCASSVCFAATFSRGEKGSPSLPLAPPHLPIRFAFSSSYHHVAGTPRSYLGFVAGRPYMSQ